MENRSIVAPEQPFGLRKAQDEALVSRVEGRLEESKRALKELSPGTRRKIGYRCLRVCAFMLLKTTVVCRVSVCGCLRLFVVVLAALFLLLLKSRLLAAVCFVLRLCVAVSRKTVVSRFCHSRQQIGTGRSTRTWRRTM